MCEVSIPNFEFLPIKYAMKKCIFSASIYIEKFHRLIQIFNNYGITKGLTMGNLHYRPNFNPGEISKIFYYSSKEHVKISRIAKFGGGML